MTGKRKLYPAEFKAKVTLGAIHGEQAIAQPAAKHGIHRSMINAWKKRPIEGMSGARRAGSMSSSWRPRGTARGGWRVTRGEMAMRSAASASVA